MYALWSLKQCSLLFPETNRSALNKNLQDVRVPLCVSAPNIKKCPQVNMEMKSKLTKSIHTQRPQKMAFSTCPKAGAQLTFKKNNPDCCFLSLFIALQELHLTDTTLRLALTWFHVGALCIFLLLCHIADRVLQTWMSLCGYSVCEWVVGLQLTTIFIIESSDDYFLH